MKILLKPKAIEFETKILAKQISDHHIEDKSPIVFICLLNGGFMFFSDLVKKCTFDFECDFMRVKSYIGKKKQGDIEITKDLEVSIKGKTIYLIDDIFDSGNTMKAVVEYLSLKKPSSINLVTLAKRKVNKWIPKETEEVDTFRYGFELDDEWVIGYGMDNDKGLCRNYPTIYEI
jgi:hypoxanthine phosphoribosyltransferase